MGFIVSRLVPRNIRRAANPIRTGKNALTPKTVKQIRGGIGKVTNPVNTLGYAATSHRPKRNRQTTTPKGVGYGKWRVNLMGRPRDGYDLTIRLAVCLVIILVALLSK